MNGGKNGLRYWNTAILGMADACHHLLGRWCLGIFDCRGVVVPDRSYSRHHALVWCWNGMKCAGLNDEIVRCIIKDLSEGYGVQDIGHRGPATEEQARYVVDFMRKHGMIDKFYRKAKRKWKKQCKLQ